MKLLLTGGGTGGHVYPALAIAEALSAEPACAPLEVLFVGSRGGLEAKLVPQAGLPIAYVRSAPLLRKISPALVSTLVDNVAGFFQALAVLHRFKPDVAVATGGYVAFPVIAALRFVRALRLSHAKLALLEANATPGLTNRLLGPLVDEIWLTVAAPGRTLGPKEVVTGTPVRASLLRAMPVPEARAALGLDLQKTTVVVMGGSQGARSLNDAVGEFAARGTLPPEWQILHVTGERDYARIAESAPPATGSLHVVPYLDDPRAAYAAADLVVARSGASTLGELRATATPALLVPYPHATGDHQAHNAEVVRASGSARVVPDRELDGARLERELHDALQPAALAAMRAAAERLVALDPRAAIGARVKRWAATKPELS